MKTFMWIKTAMICAAGAFVFNSCDDDDKGVKVPEAVQASFSQKFANATRVEWESKKQYMVADFWLEGQDYDAWFTTEGVWMMTEIDFGRDINSLPQSVKEGFNSTVYAKAPWVLEDIDQILRKDYEDVYKIEVEQGKQEKDLFFNAVGVLVKEVNDVDDDRNEGMLPSQMPSAIQGLLSEKYPGFRLVDFDLENGKYEVDIISDGKSMEVLFDKSSAWISTSVDIRLQEIPEIVKNAVTAQYAGKMIDDCEWVETAAGAKYYLIDLDNFERDLKVTEDGVISEI